jgi:hypothetical protein
MKISELRDGYYDAAGKVSERVRQFSLAGIGVIWILRVGEHTGGITYNEVLFWPLGIFVAGLAVDFVQYLYKSIIWGSLNTYYWRKHGDNDKEITISGKWNWPTVVFFWSKAALTIIGFAILLTFIVSQLRNVA